MAPEAGNKIEEPKEGSPTKQLGGPHAAVLAGIMALFGTGGMFSYRDLSAQMQAQTIQLNTMNITMAKIESREAVFQESITVAKTIADRHEARIRELENKVLTMRFEIDELRKGTPR